MQINKELLNKLMDKEAFTPPPPPVDPAMAGGMPPMDPAMMAAGGAPPPMDPAMMGVPGEAAPLTKDDVKAAVQEVLSEGEGGGDTPEGEEMTVEERLDNMERMLAALLQNSGMVPEDEVPEGLPTDIPADDAVAPEGLIPEVPLEGSVPEAPNPDDGFTEEAQKVASEMTHAERVELTRNQVKANGARVLTNLRRHGLIS